MGAIVDHALFGRIEAELLRFSFIERAPAAKKGMRSAVGIVAKRTREKLPDPGYPGDKAGKPPLKDAVGVRVYQEDTTGRLVGRVAWLRAKRGFHGHIVEKGHDIVRGGTKKANKTVRRNDRSMSAARRARIGAGKVSGNVPGKFYLANSWDETQQAQMSALEAGVSKALAGKT